MDIDVNHLCRTLNVLAISILLPKDYWTESEGRLSENVQKSSVTVYRLDS